MASITFENTFHPFTRLPGELRLKIWRTSFPGARLIRVSLDKNGNLVSNATPPISLQICRESRDETLKYYKRRLGTDPSHARIYINTERDALHLPHPRSFIDGGAPHERLVAFWEVLARATADVQDEIRAACVDTAWFQTKVLTSLRTHDGQPIRRPPFALDCRLFVFPGRDELMMPFRHTVWIPVPKKTTSGLARESQSVFGTANITSVVKVESSTNRTQRTIVPRTPLVDQDWITGFDGFGCVVRQYIESTLVKGGKSQ
ncbi:hypothetical protein DSL72_006579 [Monilinia vaccinii-corymbosi]|uniref:2EXR domain-containing protein n=1 Tax=Monilinia vaccinii-corymbosi TaxID=61207 RepID=A0A8A3PMR4_9HELO|nr:hypothetical protein DSL72_006579 [Monilinia vaccinii-corymbosi]